MFIDNSDIDSFYTECRCCIPEQTDGQRRNNYPMNVPVKKRPILVLMLSNNATGVNTSATSLALSLV